VFLNSCHGVGHAHFGAAYISMTCFAQFGVCIFHTQEYAFFHPFIPRRTCGVGGVACAAVYFTVSEGERLRYIHMGGDFIELMYVTRPYFDTAVTHCAVMA